MSPGTSGESRFPRCNIIGNILIIPYFLFITRTRVCRQYSLRFPWPGTSRESLVLYYTVLNYTVLYCNILSSITGYCIVQNAIN